MAATGSSSPPPRDVGRLLVFGWDSMKIVQWMCPLLTMTTLPSAVALVEGIVLTPPPSLACWIPSLRAILPPDVFIRCIFLLSACESPYFRGSALGLWRKLCRTSVSAGNDDVFGTPCTFLEALLQAPAFWILNPC